MGAAIEVFEDSRADRGRPRPLRAGEDHQRPAGAALRRLRPRQRTSCSTRSPTRCRSSTSTATTTSWSATSTSASPRARRRCARRASLTVEGDWTFGKGVAVVGEVEPATARSAQRVGPPARCCGDEPADELTTLTSVDDHLARILAAVAPLPDFPQPLMEALGLAVAEDVHAAMPLPSLRQLRDGRVRRVPATTSPTRRRGVARCTCRWSARSAPGRPSCSRCRPAPPSRS